MKLILFTISIFSTAFTYAPSVYSQEEVPKLECGESISKTVVVKKGTKIQTGAYGSSAKEAEENTVEICRSLLMQEPEESGKFFEKFDDKLCREAQKDCVQKHGGRRYYEDDNGQHYRCEYYMGSDLVKQGEKQLKYSCGKAEFNPPHASPGNWYIKCSCEATQDLSVSITAGCGVCDGPGECM